MSGWKKGRKVKRGKKGEKGESRTSSKTPFLALPGAGNARNNLPDQHDKDRGEIEEIEAQIGKHKNLRKNRCRKSPPCSTKKVRYIFLGKMYGTKQEKKHNTKRHLKNKEKRKIKK